MMVDETGAVAWSAKISTYGELLHVEGERHAWPFRFQGQYEDAETGIYYNRHRYYDADGGQYISQDPIGLAGGRALHGFVADPLRFIDPLGLAQCPPKSGNAGANGAPPGPGVVVTPGITAIPVPKGATGPVPVVNNAGKTTGFAYTGGRDGANGQVSTVRIMDPTPPKGASPGYPNGYVKYENANKQGVDANTGKTLPNSQSHTGL